MAVKASEIESYKGDSALAGGLGERGNAQVIQGVWNMTNSIETAMQQLRQQNFARQNREYEQKIRDRDAVGEMIASGKLQTDQMDETDRLKIGGDVDAMQKEFIDIVKRGNGKLSNEDYLTIKEKYGDLQNKANIAKVNYLTIKADEKANAELYDPNSTIKTVSKVKIDDNGEQITESVSEKGENVRRASYNQRAYQKHMDDWNAERAKNPNAVYKPFVPVSRIDDETIFAGVKTDVKEVPLENGKTRTTTTPNFGKTSQYYMNLYANPDTRNQMKIAYDDFISGGAEADLAIDATNKKLATLFPDNPQARITRQTNLPTFFTLFNYAKDYDTKTSEKVGYKNKEDYEMAKIKYNTDENIRQSRATNAIERSENLTEYKGKKEIDKQYPDGKSEKSDGGIDNVTLRSIYSSRAKAINDSDLSLDKKEERLKTLEKEIFIDGLVKTENAKKKLSLRNQNGSSALGLYQIIDETRHAIYKQMGLSDYAKADKKFKTDPEFQKEIGMALAQDLERKIPKNVTGVDRLYMLAKGWYTGDVNYPDNEVPNPKQNKMTAGQYANSILRNIGQLDENKSTTKSDVKNKQESLRSKYNY